MLKFFRQYNKWILVIGGSLLMFVFLLPVGFFTPGQGDPVVGEIDGEEIHVSDRQTAAAELQVLHSLPIVGQRVPQDDLRWLLLVRQARELGLSASDQEVDFVLQTLGVDERFLARLRQQTRLPGSFVRQAVRHWILVEQVQALEYGEAYTPLPERLYALATVQQFLQEGNFFAAQLAAGAAAGSPRVSEPLLEHFIANQQASVAGEAVLVGHERFLDQAPPPTEEALAELFEEYRDDLPGAGEPYGFGYRQPARVRLEWLTIPAEELRQAVTVDEAAALEFFEQNRARFAAPGQPAPDYLDVRAQVIDAYRQQQARQLASEIAQFARSRLDEAARRLPLDRGYRQIPPDFQPMPLEEVAAQIRERFGVDAQVERAADRGIPVAELADLPGLGNAVLASRPEVALEPYIRSALELEPDPGSPLVPLRLQVGLPTEPLTDVAGNFYIARLLHATPTRTPESLDEVREQVVEDARRLAAYQMLLDQREQFLRTARADGIEALADQVGQPTIDVGPIRGRILGAAGEAGTPEVPGIGRSQAFVDALFETARDAAQDGVVAEVPPADRIGAAGVDPRLALAVFRVDRFEPISRSLLEQFTQRPDIGAELNTVLLAGRVLANPLSIQNLAQRLGYTGEGLEEEETP